MANKILKEQARIFAQRFFVYFGQWKFSRRELIQIGYRIGYHAEHADIERKNAALDMIKEHLPLHEIDEYGFHSPVCDTCAIQSALEKAA